MVCLTSDNGTIARNYEYDPFGVQLFQSAFYDNNPYRYSGEYYDAESGYTYLRARYYDSSIGRFVSEDPALDGLNWYVYCNNNPINMVDPNGLKAVNLEKEYNLPQYKDKDALKVSIRGNEVRIVWYMYFVGDDVNKTIGSSTYRQVIKNGIQTKWSGNFTVKGHKIKVSTNMVDRFDGQDKIYATSQQFSQVTFSNKFRNKQCILWIKEMVKNK